MIWLKMLERFRPDPVAKSSGSTDAFECFLQDLRKHSAVEEEKGGPNSRSAS